MYANLRQLRPEEAGHLYAEPTYAGLEQRQVVPIVATEAFRLARHFPIAWRRSGSTFELVALRSLAPVASAAALVVPTDIQPLLVAAYPFALAAQPNGTHVVLIDDVAGQGDGDPINLAHSTFSAETQRRLTALEVFAADLERTQGFTAALAEAGLLVDWPVHLSLHGSVVGIQGLAILERDQARRRPLGDCLKQCGAELARLVTAHDLSLFKMQALADLYESGLDDQPSGQRPVRATESP